MARCGLAHCVLLTTLACDADPEPARDLPQANTPDVLWCRIKAPPCTNFSHQGGDLPPQCRVDAAGLPSVERDASGNPVYTTASQRGYPVCVRADDRSLGELLTACEPLCTTFAVAPWYPLGPTECRVSLSDHASLGGGPLHEGACPEAFAYDHGETLVLPKPPTQSDVSSFLAGSAELDIDGELHQIELASGYASLRLADARCAESPCEIQVNDFVVGFPEMTVGEDKFVGLELDLQTPHIAFSGLKLHNSNEILYEISYGQPVRIRAEVNGVRHAGWVYIARVGPHTYDFVTGAMVFEVYIAGRFVGHEMQATLSLQSTTIEVAPALR